MMHREQQPLVSEQHTPNGSCDTAGPRGARAIVFVHGTRVNRKMWLPQMEGLAEQHRVIAPDLPGHGTLTATPFRWESALARLREVIEEEAGGRALLVGSSLGGYLALELARREPRSVTGLVLSGCCLSLRGAIRLPFQAGARLLPLCSERWLTWTHNTLCRRWYPAAYAEPIIAAGFSFRAVPDVLQALMGTDPLHALRTFDGPVLFLNGAKDRLFRLHERAFLGAARRARLQVIERATHRCNLEQARAFTAAVRVFALNADNGM